MSEQDRRGWWDVEPAEEWTCPECRATSPVEDWREVEPGCEDCGNHDGRECPRCGEWFDHVFGGGRIQAANQEAKT